MTEFSVINRKSRATNLTHKVYPLGHFLYDIELVANTEISTFKLFKLICSIRHFHARLYKLKIYKPAAIFKKKQQMFQTQSVNIVTPDSLKVVHTFSHTC